MKCNIILTSTLMLLDKYLPRYTYKEYHEIRMAASEEQAYNAARELDFSNSDTIRFLFKMRGLPTDDMTIDGFARRVNFTFLEEIKGEEFAIGFWVRSGIEKIADTDQFIKGNTLHRLKVAWNFKVEPAAGGRVAVSTETRILCTTKPTLVLFSLYWAMIRPFSGLIRRKMLGLIKEKAEQSIITRQS